MLMNEQVVAHQEAKGEPSQGTGWLIEKQQSALGVVDGQPCWLSYTEPGVIRFARERDAVGMLLAWKSFGWNGLEACYVSEHLWGEAEVKHQWRAVTKIPPLGWFGCMEQGGPRVSEDLLVFCEEDSAVHVAVYFEIDAEWRSPDSGAKLEVLMWRPMVTLPTDLEAMKAMDSVDEAKDVRNVNAN